MSSKSTIILRPKNLVGLLLAVALVIAAQFLCSEFDIDFLITSPGVVEEKVSGDWIRVYFTSPRYPDDEAYHHDGLDERLTAAIDDAATSVDLVAYDFDLPRVTNALIEAHRRGVAVRVVVESDNADEEAVGRLIEGDIPVVEDERESGLMHNKFAVIDDERVWTGSWNMTLNGTFRNNNNAVLVTSTALAENYRTEFEEMFNREFGPTSAPNTPHPNITLTVEIPTPEGETDQREVKLENHFSPETEVDDRIIELIEGAQDRIRFMAFTFTSEMIADALIERAEEGIVVQGVVEARNADRPYSQYGRIKEAAHDVLEDGNPYIMHHKVIIVDDATVILGSYNFTASAEESNDENVLIVHDPEVAASYVEEFGRVYETARTAE